MLYIYTTKKRENAKAFLYTFVCRQTEVKENNKKHFVTSSLGEKIFQQMDWVRESL
jgi:hypothetical protein